MLCQKLGIYFKIRFCFSSWFFRLSLYFPGIVMSENGENVRATDHFRSAPDHFQAVVFFRVVRSRDHDAAGGRKMNNQEIEHGRGGQTDVFDNNFLPLVFSEIPTFAAAAISAEPCRPSWAMTMIFWSSFPPPFPVLSKKERQPGAIFLTASSLISVGYMPRIS